MAGTTTPQALRVLVKRLEPLNGCGLKTRKNLKERFQTAETLLGASVDAIAAAGKTSHQRATQIRMVLHGEMVPEKKWAGVERVVVWNTLTKKKVAGAAAPKADQADTWLVKNPRYERYAGQDKQQKSELHVPEPCLLDEAAYEGYCAHPTGDEQQLKSNLDEYGLRLAPTDALSQNNTTMDKLCAAISCAASYLGHTRSELQASNLPARPGRYPWSDTSLLWLLQASLQRERTAASSSTASPSLLSMLQAASRLLKRPVWVFTSSADARCVCEVGDEVDPKP